jgi:hypothetical protein
MGGLNRRPSNYRNKSRGSVLLIPDILVQTIMKRFPTLLACLFLTACSLFAQRAYPVGIQISPVGVTGEGQTTYPAPFPARGGDVDWGLALSGGGLRSAAFSIGAMKALYDLELLDDIDVISSVSGGGYASYWLYSRYDGGEGRFGDAAFSDSAFPTEVCMLARRSRFFPFHQMIAAVFSPRGVAFRSYRRAIERSFSTDATRDRPLDALMSAISAAKAPYFILNTSLKSLPKIQGQNRNKVERSFEITPGYRGNRALGYDKWSGDEIDVKTWAEGVAMSGAAVRFKLSRKIRDFSGKRRLDLADGGLSENLSALPLILRGVKNVIIVDAENDPGYKFESYCTLQKYLRSIGVELSVRSIDSFVDCANGRRKTPARVFTEAPVVRGEAVSRSDYSGSAIDTDIYYIKMSRPVSIFSESAIRAEGISADDLEYEDRRRPDECPAGQLEPINRHTMLLDVLSYARHLNGDWRWGKFIEFLPYINYNFPQITTIDQTFYKNQLDAFIGLGYLEGCGMESLVSTAKSCGQKSRL